jgi:hypothetical protein
MAIHGDRRRAAVDHVGTGVARGELEGDRVARVDHPVSDVRGNARRVKVDRVWHRRLVHDLDADQVAFANANHRTGYGAAERPSLVLHALGDLDCVVSDRDDEFLDVGIGCRGDPRVVCGIGGSDGFSEIDAHHRGFTPGSSQAEAERNGGRE